MPRLPLFAAGGLSPADALLDLGVAAILIRLLGIGAVLPTLLAELAPGFDLFPTWTAAVFYVTRQRVRSEEPEILPPGAPLPRVETKSYDCLTDSPTKHGGSFSRTFCQFPSLFKLDMRKEFSGCVGM
jgi:hypothetical protein